MLPNVTLRQLQIFETVVRLGGVTLAAKSLNLSLQPTVSMQVKKPSETLDLPLLENTGRQVHATAIGREVYTTAQEILGSFVALGDLADELRGEMSSWNCVPNKSKSLMLCPFP